MKISTMIVVPTLLSCVVCSAMAQSKVSERSTTRKTYPYSDPDPVAKPQTTIYPYFRFDGYTNKPQQKEWKVVELENDYIRLSIYPEIGGKVWGAVEKKSGANFLYDNSVVKFREVAMRGAWTSGGIEFNFGIIGHAPSTSSPVDYVIRENEADGSVSCVVGTIDLITHTWWNVEIKLEKDKAYFTTDSYWYNPQPITAPYYHWTTAGYPVSDGLEFIFPGQYYIEHSGKTESWIKDSKGRDISWYKNNNFGEYKSYHVSGELADHFGGYYHDKGWGSLHSNATGEKLGMKVWLWGLARSGMIWEDLLTDTDGQYTEWQSGRLYNQEGGDSHLTPYKHMGFAPAASEEFIEYWYPTLATEGVAATNSYGTLNYKYENGAYRIMFSPLQNLDERLVVECDGKTILDEKIAVKPLELWSKTLSVAKGELKITLGDGLLIYDPKPQITSRPKVLPAEFDWNSLYGHYTKGRQMIYARFYEQAEEAMASALRIDPLYAPALVDLAVLKYRRGYHDQAKELAMKALSLNTYDPEANMIYAVASAALGHTVDAIDGYTVAAMSAQHRVAGLIGAAKSYAVRQEWQRVIYYARKALDGGFNPESYQLLSVAYRNLGDSIKSEEALSTLEQKMPLNHFITAERTLNGTLPSEALTEAVRAELPHEIFVELGLWYAGIGAGADALKIYETVPSHPLIAYHQAYLTSDESYIAKAEAASVELVFPSRVEYLPVMQWAAQRSNNWKSKYYNAILQLSLRHESDKAVASLEKLGENPDYAPFYLSRAMIVAPEKALGDILKAESVEKSWRTGVALINEYKRLEQFETMLKVATDYRKTFPENDKVAIGYIESLMANHRYSDALKVMRGVNLLPFEGGIIGRTMFREANLNLAIDAYHAKRYKQAIQYVDDSEEWIENLGVGKPYDADIDTRSEEYLRAVIYEKMGEKDKASALVHKIAEARDPLNSNTILTALSLRKLGLEREAAELIAQYQIMHFNRDAARWSKALFEGDTDATEELSKNGNMNTTGSPFGTNYRDYGYITIVKRIVEL